MPQRAPKHDGITPGQIKMIKAAQRMLGLDDDTYRDMLENIAGVRSATQLDQDGVTRVIAHLSRCGFTKVRHTGTEAQRHKGYKPRSTRPAGKVVAMATPEQLDKIAALAGLIEWHYENGLELFMQKRLGITRVRTDHDAFTVIEALKGMFENGMKKRFGPNWKGQVYPDPAVMRYIAEHTSGDRG